MNRFGVISAIVVLGAYAALAQTAHEPAAGVLRRSFVGVNVKVLTMAKDFPVDRYDYKLKPEMRTFGAVIVHIASGNLYAARAAKGEKVRWDSLEENPAKYKTKRECVALLERSIGEANAALSAYPEGPQKNLDPFLSVMQHASEHYGLLVAYYRANGLVPPDSRPKK